MAKQKIVKTVPKRFLRSIMDIDAFDHVEHAIDQFDLAQADGKVHRKIVEERAMRKLEC